jgi:hypothetical protein
MKRSNIFQFAVTGLVVLILLGSATGCKKEYTLRVTILPLAGGTVDLTPSGGTYEEGTEVTLVPNHATDYEFTTWSGTDGTSVNNNKVIMSKNIDITANFELNKTMIRLKTGTGLNNGAMVYFFALSKTDNYLDYSDTEIFAFQKTDADWYIDGSTVPFTTDYKELLNFEGQRYFFLEADGIIVIGTIIILKGKQTVLISGSTFGGVDINIEQPKKSGETKILRLQETQNVVPDI